MLDYFAYYNMEELITVSVTRVTVTSPDYRCMIISLIFAR